MPRFYSSLLDIAQSIAYINRVMRVYEVVMRSGAKTEVTAEVLHDDPSLDDKIYFYRDKGLKQLVAYFIRDQVAGIVLGPDTGAVQGRPVGRL